MQSHIVKIEEYRGETIIFDRDDFKFKVLGESFKSRKAKDSLMACRKLVDDYIKESKTFIPFNVVELHRFSRVSLKTLKITSRRKDKKLVGLKEDGSKETISDYSLGDYYLIQESDSEKLKSIASYLSEISEYEKIIRELGVKIDFLKGQMTNLKDYNKELLSREC